MRLPRSGVGTQALKAQIEMHKQQEALRVLSEKEEAKKRLQEIEAQKMQIEKAKVRQRRRRKLLTLHVFCLAQHAHILDNSPRGEKTLVRRGL